MYFFVALLDRDLIFWDKMTWFWKNSWDNDSQNIQQADKMLEGGYLGKMSLVKRPKQTEEVLSEVQSWHLLYENNDTIK